MMIAFDRASADPAFELLRGDAPLLVSMPHVGTGLPPQVVGRLTPEGVPLADTDWHLPIVYDFAAAMGATVLVATQSRYLIDLNRPPDGSSLYPGMATTSLVPTQTFRGEPLWRDAPPGDDEIAARRERWWQPYHSALDAELARLRTLHPRVVLWDAHSIASVLPRFFEGRLPDLNFGTADGASCDPSLIEAVLAPVRAQSEYGARDTACMRSSSRWPRRSTWTSGRRSRSMPGSRPGCARCWPRACRRRSTGHATGAERGCVAPPEVLQHRAGQPRAATLAGIRGHQQQGRGQQRFGPAVGGGFVAGLHGGRPVPRITARPTSVAATVRHPSHRRVPPAASRPTARDRLACRPPACRSRAAGRARARRSG